MSEGESGWRVVSSKIVIDTPHLRLRADDIQLPSGRQIGPYYVRESRGFAVVFALRDDGRVVLVRQYKHGIARFALELPAGAIDPDETPETCARRELAEETGYEAPGPFELLGTFFVDPTNATTRFYLYLARGAVAAGDQRLDETEDIALSTASLEELRAYCRDGTITVATHVAAIYFTLDYLGRL